MTLNSCNFDKSTCPYLNSTVKQYIRKQTISLSMKYSFARREIMRMYSQHLTDINQIKELNWAVEKRDKELEELTARMNFYKSQLEKACSID